MIGEVPGDVGATHLTLSDPTLVVAVIFVGVPGTTAGEMVLEVAADAELVPAAVVAVTLHEYVAPRVRLVMVHVSDAVVQPSPAPLVTWYDTMGSFPLVSGALHDRVTDVPLTVAVGVPGALGRSNAGTEKGTGADGRLVPAALVAVIVSEMFEPGVSPLKVHPACVGGV